MWFRNFYHCDDCGTDWEDEWSCCCDDECPNCGSSDWSPHESEELSVVVQIEDHEFVVLHSPRSVEEHEPHYREVARLPLAQVARAIKEAILPD